MTFTIIIGAIVVFFAFLQDKNKFSHGLKISFLILTLFLGLRYNFGNDYQSYLNGFNEINRYSYISFFDTRFYFDPGWVFICKLFNPFGFFSLIFFLSIVNCVVYYKVIKRYVPQGFYWLAVFLYFFTPGFMLVHLSAIRQSISILIFLFIVKYIYMRKPLFYFTGILIASFFHQSALILSVFYTLIFFSGKIKNQTGLLLGIAFFVLFFISNIVFLQLDNFILTFFPKYLITYSQLGSVIGSGIGIFLYLVLFIILL